MFHGALNSRLAHGPAVPLRRSRGRRAGIRIGRAAAGGGGGGGGLVEVASVTAGSDTTVLQLSGLTIDTSKRYLLACGIKQTTAPSYIRANSMTTGWDSVSDRSTGSDGPVDGFGNIWPKNTGVSHNIAWVDLEDVIEAMGGGCTNSNLTGGSGYHIRYGGTNDTMAAITTLEVVHGTTNGINTGSWMKLYEVY